MDLKNQLKVTKQSPNLILTGGPRLTSTSFCAQDMAGDIVRFWKNANVLLVVLFVSRCSVVESIVQL